MGIVPDDFDLEEAKQARTTTPREEMNKCPECSSVKVWRKDGRKAYRHEHPDADWYCKNCDSNFDEPA